MPRLALANICIGFWVLFLAAAAGTFVATDLTSSFLAEGGFRATWATVLTSSAHGHTNLFGLLHIVFGLTMPYSRLAHKWQLLQTIGFGLGVVAMGPGMLIRSQLPPTPAADTLGAIIGALLAAALTALFTHAAALTARIIRRV